MKVGEKGKRGEREVVHLWVAYGWDDAVKSPSSGGIRRYGAGDLSPWPGDVAGISPWICEVKHDEELKRPSRNGWVGEGFTRRTLIDLEKLWARHAGTIGKRVAPIPVLFARPTYEDWRVFVQATVFEAAVGASLGGSGWVQLYPEQFFDDVAIPLRDAAEEVRI